MRVLIGILFVIAVLIAALGLLFGLIALGRRGSRHGSGQLGTAMQNLEGLFVESRKHVIEIRQDEHSDEDDSGEPPDA